MASKYSTRSITNPGAEAFKTQFSQLAQAIHSPIVLASELYSKDIIPQTVVDKVLTAAGLSDGEKNITLLTAVDSRLRTQPSEFETLLSVLEKSSALSLDCAVQLRQAYDAIKQGPSTECQLMSRPPQHSTAPEVQEQPSQYSRPEAVTPITRETKVVTVEEIAEMIPRTAIVTDVHIAEIAPHILNWEELAPFLGISSAEEEEIRNDFQGRYGLQKREVLRKWKERMSSNATYHALVEVFCFRKKTELATKVKDLIVPVQ